MTIMGFSTGDEKLKGKLAVFVSYSTIDKSVARKIASILEKNRIDYFLDEKQLKWGEQISKEIKRAIAESTEVIVVISPASHCCPVN